MPKLNADWHARHRLPRRASLDQRVRWHASHAEACGCRPMPKSVAAVLAARSGESRTVKRPPRVEAR